MLAVTVASITYSLSGANRLGTPGSLRHLFQMTFVTEGQSAFAGVPRVVVARSGVALAPGEGQGRLVGVAAHGARAERGHQAAAFSSGSVGRDADKPALTFSGSKGDA